MTKYSGNSIKIALIQNKYSIDLAANTAKNINSITAAGANGANIIVLPELHNSLYFCATQNLDNFNLAESIPGPTTKLLGQYAKKYNAVIIGSVFERRARGIYHNTAVIINADGNIAGIYRKMHIPDDPGFNEKYYFTPGDLGFQPINTIYGKLGVLICWDQWFPEAARVMAINGAEVLIYPTAIGWDPSDSQLEQQRQLDAWKIIQQSHAIANHLPVLTCNRVGSEANTIFWGNSFICSGQGEILNTVNNSEEIIYGAINIRQTEKLRQIWPFFRDRRIDSYRDLLKKYQ